MHFFSLIMIVSDDDLALAVDNVLLRLPGIESLYPCQMEVLTKLIAGENVFWTAPTNAGKTLPPVLLPSVMQELITLGYSFPANPKVLFLTALNSIKLSLVSSMRSLGLKCSEITRENAQDVLLSSTCVLFISPEVLKTASVTQALLKSRSEFVAKIVDEAHLGKCSMCKQDLYCIPQKDVKAWIMENFLEKLIFS